MAQSLLSPVSIGLFVADHTDPATGEKIAEVPDMSKEEVLEAVKAAEEAYPGWSNTAPKVSTGSA